MGDLGGLVSIAAQLVARVHDDDPDRNARWLAAVTNEFDRWALLFVLAAMVPDDRSVADLLAWVESGIPDSCRPQALCTGSAELSTGLAGIESERGAPYEAVLAERYQPTRRKEAA